uniref:Uncharacterized protein n=1 Tax=uncultured marine group II/III euryarchaeote AD1000_86_F07 TaxID=1457816 RepID=A0A075FZC1_9EURY|nr:hypothetical protein [uncultured marine group II/III euryarchaeote AD1000_86_F07]
MSPLESGSQPLGGGLSITPIQLLSDLFHSIVNSISRSMNAVGADRSSFVIPTGHPAVSSVQGTNGTLVRLVSRAGPYRLPMTSRAQTTPTTAGRTERMRTIMRITSYLCHCST